MKYLKNNKGVTGIDLAISIIIIIFSVTLITVMYSRYVEKSKEVERNSKATNIAVQLIEEIKSKDYEKVSSWFFDDVDDDGIKEKTYEKIDNDEIKTNFLNIEIPNGYIATIKKIDEIEDISIKLKVEVEYKIGDKSQKTELSITKSKANYSANVPDLTSEEVKDITKKIIVDGKEGEYKRYFLKYSNTKKGYIEAKASDDDWYSISGKKFAVIAYAKEAPIPFNTNGEINFNECAEIYVWVPRFGIDGDGNYRFCNEATNNPIIYEAEDINLTIEDSTYSVAKYVVDTTISGITVADFDGTETGKWVKVNSDLNPIKDDTTEITDEENILNILKTKEFTWKE